MQTLLPLGSTFAGFRVEAVVGYGGMGTVFFFNEPATTEIYTTVHTRSLHDALPISFVRAAEHEIARGGHDAGPRRRRQAEVRSEEHTSELQSRTVISYAVFCLK